MTGLCGPSADSGDGVRGVICGAFDGMKKDGALLLRLSFMFCQAVRRFPSKCFLAFVQ